MKVRASVKKMPFLCQCIPDNLDINSSFISSQTSTMFCDTTVFIFLLSP